MRVAFFGTPDVAAVALRRLIGSHHEIVVAVTQPDRPRGRSGTPQPPPAKQVAAEAGIPVLQPPTPKQDSFAPEFAAFSPDACVVVAYGHLLPPAVLAVPPRGTYNAHFSLLPRYRGAAPVQRAIMNGDDRTGVCVFLLEPTLDTGPVLERVEVAIEDDDTTGTLLARLAPIGADALVRTLDAVEDGTAEPKPQRDEAATPAPKIKPDEGEIDWSHPAERIRNLIRGLNPSPGAYTFFKGKRVKIWSAALADEPGEPGEPGAAIPVAGGFAIAAGEGAIVPTELQPEGKRRMTADEFLRGYRPGPTTRFGRDAADR
ncbi:MAG TPA: methionyl-tRNA formyltransferase [Actinomycetota bacterium]|nr:methionyl-tRNA formyltransferase [Actinomycetota bacterium]